MYKNDYHLYRIVDSFFRHWRVFVLAFVCVSGVVGSVLYSRSKSFIASATTQIISDDRVADAVGQGENKGWNWVTVADQNAQHFRDLMRDNQPDGFIESALKSANLKVPIDVNPAANDKRFDALMKNLRVSGESKDMFTLQLTWDDPDECTALLRGFQQQYIEEAGLNHQATSIAVTQYLKSEISKYEKRMGEAETALIKYKQEHSGELPEAQLKRIEQVSNLRLQLDFLGFTAKDAVLKQQALEKELSRIKPVSIKEATVGTNPVSLEIHDLQTKRRDLLSANWLPTSQKVMSLDNRITTLQKQLTEDLKSDATYSSTNITETKLEDNPQFRQLSQQLAEVKSQRTMQAERVRLITQQIRQYDGDIARIPAAEKELTAKTRDYTILRKHYEDLMERREQASLKASLERITESSTFRPIGRVYAESTAGTKKTLLTFGGSALLGLFVGLALVLLSEWLDSSLRYTTDTYRLLGVPVLVSLPEAKEMRFLPSAPNTPLPAPPPAITG